MSEDLRTFGGNEYRGTRYLTQDGDTITEYIPTGLVRKGDIYKYRSLLKKGDNGKTSAIRTKQESGEIAPGPSTVISPTSSWGTQLQLTFTTNGLPLKNESFLDKWTRKIFGFKKGGNMRKLIKAYNGTKVREGGEGGDWSVKPGTFPSAPIDGESTYISQLNPEGSPVGTYIEIDKDGNYRLYNGDYGLSTSDKDWKSKLTPVETDESIMHPWLYDMIFRHKVAANKFYGNPYRENLNPAGSPAGVLLEVDKNGKARLINADGSPSEVNSSILKSIWPQVSNIHSSQVSDYYGSHYLPRSASDGIAYGGELPEITVIAPKVTSRKKGGLIPNPRKK